MCCCQNQSCSCCKSKCQSGCCCSQKSCSCCACQSCSCQSCGCGGQCKCGNGKECNSNATNKFFNLADCAWKEVLKEKIKEHIKANAKNMDELARMISEANHERWQKKMENKACCCNFEQQLGGFFGQMCKTKK